MPKCITSCPTHDLFSIDKCRSSAARLMESGSCWRNWKPTSNAARCHWQALVGTRCFCIALDTGAWSLELWQNLKSSNSFSNIDRRSVSTGPEILTSGARNCGMFKVWPTRSRTSNWLPSRCSLPDKQVRSLSPHPTARSGVARKRRRCRFVCEKVEKNQRSVSCGMA